MPFAALMAACERRKHARSLAAHYEGNRIGADVEYALVDESAKARRAAQRKLSALMLIVRGLPVTIRRIDRSVALVCSVCRQIKLNGHVARAEEVCRFQLEVPWDE